jgi:potassium-transporting ATPase KdpC subunit
MEKKESTRNIWKTALILLGLFTVLCGLVYPLLITGIAQIVLHDQANGSLIIKNGKDYGSSLIGQPFSNPKYFWGRLSATPEFPYNASTSSGSNYGPLNPALREKVSERIAALKSYDPESRALVPVDLVTFSASGLDPHISRAAAVYQVRRVAKFRNMSDADILVFVDKYTEDRFLGFIGEPRVNVLMLNLAMDHVL